MIKFYVKNAGGDVLSTTVVSNTSLRKIKAYTKPIGLQSNIVFFVWVYERRTAAADFMLITVLKFENERFLSVQS